MTSHYASVAPGRRHTLWPSAPNATAGSRKPSSAGQRGVADASDGVTVEVQPECVLVHAPAHACMHACTCTREQLRCNVRHAAAAQVQSGAASQQPPANAVVDMSEAEAEGSGVVAHAGLGAAPARNGGSRSATFDPVVPFASD